MAPSRREKFCAISALFLRIVETERGINCVQKTLYQFPRDSLFASFRGDDSHRGILSRCTLTPMEGWASSSSAKREERARRGGMEVDAIYASLSCIGGWNRYWRHVLQARARYQLFLTAARVRAMLKIMREVARNVFTLAWHVLINSRTLPPRGKEYRREHIATLLESRRVGFDV